MSVENQKKEYKGEQNSSLRDIYEFLARNRKWFIASVLVSLLLGYLYTKRITPQYVSTSRIRIDDNYRRDNDVTDMTNLSSGSLLRVNSQVEDELFVLRSRTLISEVVRELEANVCYFTPGKLRRQELYSGDFPFKVKIEKMPVATIEASVIHRASGEFAFKIDGGSEEEKANYGVPFNIDGHTFTISENEDSGMPAGDIYYVKIRPIDKAVRHYQAAVSVSLSSNATNVVAVTVKDPVPQRAADFTNLLVEIYNRDAIADKRMLAESRVEFIDERLRVVGGELDEVDGEVEAFKKDNASVNIQSEAGIFLEDRAKVEQETMEVATQISLLNSISSYLKQYKGEFKLLPSNIGIDDSGLRTGIEQYNALVMERNRLVGDSDVSTNPVVRNMSDRILNLQSAISESIDNITAALKLKEQAINKRGRVLSGKVHNVPTIEKEGLSIARQQKIKESLYLFLLNRREESGLKAASALPIAKVIDTATASEEPVSPRLSVTMLIALLLGALLPLGILLLIDQLKTVVTSRREVEERVSAPIVGEIPRREIDTGNEIVVSNASRDPVSEAFRLLRTNLDFMFPAAEGCRVIMMTSSDSGDGKTFTSINLAASLAIAGKKTLLIDLDLRKGTVAKLIANSNKDGISAYLAGRIDNLASILVKSYVSELDLLYAGMIPPNPAELLMKTQLDKAIDELKKVYEYIIIDSSPVGLVADGVIANRVADLTIYPVRINKSDKKTLISLERLYENKTLNNLVVLLTDVHFGKGYGYGYLDDGRKSTKSQKSTISSRIKRVFH